MKQWLSMVLGLSFIGCISVQDPIKTKVNQSGQKEHHLVYGFGFEGPIPPDPKSQPQYDDRYIVYILPKSEWESSKSARLYMPKSLNTAGIISCSRIDQLATVADRDFRNQQGLVILVIDTRKVKAGVEYVNMGVPQVRGPLDTAAVVREIEFSADPDGKFIFPQELHVYK